MKKRSKILLAAVLIFLFLALAGNSNKTSTPPAVPVYTNASINATQGAYGIGIGYFALGNQSHSPDDAIGKISEAANVAFVQRHWVKEENPNGQDYYLGVAEEVRAARSRNMKVYLAFEILSADRKDLNLPNGSVGSFADQKVREDYKALVKKVAQDYTPEYFIISVEASHQKKQNASEYEAYNSLFSEAYDEIKSASPDTKVAASLVYEDANGKDCFDDSDLEAYKVLISEFPKADMLAMSTYPMCYFTPDKIPIDFISKVANASELPLFISETGWIGNDAVITSSFTFKSSPEMQADYIVRLSQMVEYARSHGKEIEAINYVSLVDPSDEVCNLIISRNPTFGWYCTLALLDSGWNEKPAFQRMKEWLVQIRS